MRPPPVRAKVHVKNHLGVFLVVWVSLEEQTASLIRVDQALFDAEATVILDDVPFADIEPMDLSTMLG